MPAKNRSPKSPAKKSTAPAKEALAHVVADAKLATNANTKRAEALLDLIARRKARIAEDFYEIGKALKELFEKKLHVALGYASFAAMLSAREVMSMTQARKLIVIVGRVPLATALKLGPEKAFAITKYTDATPELDTPELVVEGGGKVAGKPVEEASRREIDAETRKLRKKAAAKKGKADPAEREAAKLAKGGTAWLKARGVKKVKVEARRTKEGHVVVITLALAEATALFEE